MPQTWLVVQCYQCHAFQVDQEKKAKKWQCKLCGEKQSLQRVFARSHSAKDCRLVVQSYNTARGAVEAADEEQALAEAEAVAATAGWDGDGSGDCAAYGNQYEEEEQQQQQLMHGYGGEAQHQRPLQQHQRWQAYQEGDEEEEAGWTVSVPERPAPKQKRGGGQASGVSSGSKRRRRQQHEVDEVELPLGWGAAPGSGGPAGWESMMNGSSSGSSMQHRQQQQQSQAQHHQQQRPLASKNGWGVAGQAPAWQGPQHPASCVSTHAPPQRQQTAGAWQQQPLRQQQQQQCWDEAGTGQQHEAQHARQWAKGPPPAAAAAAPPLPPPAGAGAARPAGAGKWGGYVDAEDDW